MNMKKIYFDKELAPAIIRAIAQARRSIAVAVYQLSPDAPTSHQRLKELWHELRFAGQRGLNPRAIICEGGGFLPGRKSALLAKLALEVNNWEVKLWPDGQIMHAKMLIIDSEQVFLGSHNWTQGGLLANREASLWSDDRETVKQAEDWFNSIWLQHH